MKKFYLAAVMALVFAACGGSGKQSGEKSEAVPAEIEQLVQTIKTHMEAEQDEKVFVRDVYVDGNDIICVIVVEEALMEGKTMKETLLVEGISEQDFINIMKYQMMKKEVRHPDRLEPLRKYHYNVLYRYVGSRSGERIDILMRYDEFPKI